MRITLLALGFALVLTTVSSVGVSSVGVSSAAPTSARQARQRPAATVDARSAALVAQARAELAGGRLEAANDGLESALAIDPENPAAFTTLAQVALRQNLPGKAIRLYREALAIEPNDIGALAGQGEAMVAKGAVTKARENLARLKSLCNGGCADATRLSAAIDRGPPPVVKSAQASVPAKDTP